MNAEVLLYRHFSRMGARVRLRGLDYWQQRNGTKIGIDIGRDRYGEFFDIRREDGLVPDVLDVRPAVRHMVLMVRERKVRNKFLLGHDERHWFVAAVPGDSVRDVRTAIASLRPHEARTSNVIRQGEWFFVPAPQLDVSRAVIHRQEPLSRGARSKPHICEELIRRGGETVMVSTAHPAGITLAQYGKLTVDDPGARAWLWRRMVRDAEVYVRGAVRHPDHKTVELDGWHRVYMNRERFARNASQVAFLD